MKGRKEVLIGFGCYTSQVLRALKVIPSEMKYGHELVRRPSRVGALLFLSWSSAVRRCFLPAFAEMTSARVQVMAKGLPSDDIEDMYLG